MSGRRARVLAIAMYVAAAFCCLKVAFRVFSAPAINPILLINIFLWDVILAVVLILGARRAWAQDDAPGMVAPTDLE